jgi:hypothetical protein
MEANVRLAMGASRPKFNSRTAWLDGARDSRAIYTGYASINLIKKRREFGRETWRRRGGSLAAVGCGGSGVTERWLASGAAGPGTRPPAAAVRRVVVAGRAAAPRPGHQQPILRAAHRYSGRPSSPRATIATHRRATRSRRGGPWLGRPAGIVVCGVVIQEEGTG